MDIRTKNAMIRSGIIYGKQARRDPVDRILESDEHGHRVSNLMILNPALDWTEAHERVAGASNTPVYNNWPLDM